MSALEILGIVSSACAIVFGYLAFSRNKKHDDKEDAKNDATLLTEIGYIKANTDEIKSEQKEQRKMNMDIERRLTSVEESAKQAHKRIDSLSK